MRTLQQLQTRCRQRVRTGSRTRTGSGSGSGVTLSRMCSGATSAVCAPSDMDSFAFSGCGWLTPFHLGVIKALREEGCITSESIVSGSSGGSIAATLVSAGICTSDAMKVITHLATNKEFNKDKDKGIQQVILDMLPGQESYKQCNGHLHITVTQVSPTLIKRALVISEFESNEDLASTVSTSCFIPLWSSYALSTAFRGTRALDGGVFAFMPPVGNVTVTPFPGAYSFLTKSSRRGGKGKQASISPLLLPREKRIYSEARLGYWGLNPPPAPVLYDLFDYGARAADIWIKNRADGTQK